MLHVKLKGITNAATRKYIFCPYTHPRFLGWAKGKKKFLKVVTLHIKIMGIKHKASCKHIFWPYTHPQPLGWGQNILLTESSHVAIRRKWNIEYHASTYLSLHIPSTPEVGSKGQNFKGKGFDTSYEGVTPKYWIPINLHPEY